MKALTLWWPWADAIFFLGKDIENRNWPPPQRLIGQRLAIHCGKREDKIGVESILQIIKPGDTQKICLMLDESRRRSKGSIIGLVTLTGWTLPSKTTSPWAFGTMCWELSNALALPHPIPCKGYQGLWDISGETELEIRDQLVDK